MKNKMFERSLKDKQSIVIPLWGECECDCHHIPEMVHCMPCCSGRCKICGKFIMGDMKQHLTECGACDKKERVVQISNSERGSGW